MSKLNLIIRREFLSKVRNKSFIVMTFLSPLLFVGIAVFVGFLSTMKPEIKTIAVHDDTGNYFSLLKNNEEYHFTDFSAIDIKTLKDSIISEAYEGLLVIPKEANPDELATKIDYISNDSPNFDIISNLEKTISQSITQQKYASNGLDTLKIRELKSKVAINIKKASGEKSIQGLKWVKTGAGGAFGYLIMMFIVLYGNMVMRSVIEEKTSRIIEVIISSVKPFQLMMGKIVGTSLAGILQFLIWAILGLSAMFILSSVFGVNVGAAGAQSQQAMEMASKDMSNIQMYMQEIWNLPIATILISFVLYFIGGYFLYSSFYAAIGAAVDNETDSQQFLLPIIMPLILGVYIGFFTVINDPHGTIATVFSMIPLTSPIVMMMRIPFGVPIWQIAVSLAILFGTFMFVVWFAAKIYRVGILMYGKKPTWKELYKWSKY